MPFRFCPHTYRRKDGSAARPAGTNTGTGSLPTNKARQGRRGPRVLLVLIAGLILVGVVWPDVEFYGETIDAGSVDHGITIGND